MFGKAIRTGLLLAIVALASKAAMAESFGVGDNQFTIDFVTISGATNPDGSNAYGIVNNDYRMGKFEITNDQWNKFTASLGVPVTGADWGYYDSSLHTGPNMPTDSVSWYEAAQFVNWLNTSTGHQVAYKFTGTQGNPNYTLATWSAADAAGGTNLYRHKNAFYYIPTEDEWVKAAYWNGSSLQDHATMAGEELSQGSGTSGIGWNYYHNYGAPWDVGSGSRELNGTFDMMGNNCEWVESPSSSGDYAAGAMRVSRGGYWFDSAAGLARTARVNCDPTSEYDATGFRVASASVPEPCSLAMLVGIALTAVVCRRARRA